jgi:CRISPR-associated protein Csd1
MSWIQKLYDTYNNCEGMIGAGADDNSVPLLPICHTTQKAQLEIVLDHESKFIRARLIPKNEARTIIPCTENSGGRTSGECPHPLCDKLQYIAKDYKEYGGNKDSYFQSYIEQLSKWVDFDKNKKVKIIYDYVMKGCLLADLIQHKILFVDRDFKLLKQREGKKENKDILDIFDLLPGRINKKGEIENWQADAFVRWSVEIPNDFHTSVWNDQEVWISWIHYYSQTKKSKSLCYVTGEEEFAADQHPAKLRSDGDKAKIISSNDLSGFTFRGRFLSAEQVANIGFVVTQKAHSALRWLIDRQGYRGKDGQAIVAWATSGAEIPQPTDDPLKILGFDELPSDQSSMVATAQEIALKLKTKIKGYNKELGDTTSVVVIGLDSVTPGRMSITFYKELTGSDFLERLDKWHEKGSWIHRYGYDKETKRHFTFVGAPAPVDIAFAAYGLKADDRLIKATVARLIQCIIDGKPIPRDIVESAVKRACKPIVMEEWEWNKTLSIACSLYKKYSKEDFNMNLDENRTTRDYLYGRLLAIADRLEGQALYKAKEKRETNAARYMQLFAEHPFKTWRQIELALSPYKARLRGAHYFTKLIDEVMCKFAVEDFNSDKALSGEFLLSYHCQRAELWKDNSDIKDDDSTEQE